MIRGLILAGALMGLTAPAAAADVDWKMYGSTSGPSEICFYEAKGVARTPDRHVCVWTKCLSQKDMDNMDPNSDVGRRVIDSAARKYIDGYVPPLALVEDATNDQA